MRFAPQEKRTYFITASTDGRRRLFQVEANASLMVQTLKDYQAQRKYELHAYVVMPDHIHLLLTPAYEIPLEKVLQFIKGGFSFRLRSKLGVWERDDFTKRVPDRGAYDATITYIHNNPVKANLCASREDFRWSSFADSTVDLCPAWFQ